ncbi:hypothetical protein ACXYRQ_04045 [Mycoplasma sp. 394]
MIKAYKTTELKNILDKELLTNGIDSEMFWLAYEYSNLEKMVS